MGRYCGYLALMSALASGAERVYLNEEGVTLRELQKDVELLVEGFSHGKRLGVMIRNEKADEVYDTNFTRALLEEEGGDLFEVRQSILGHLLQGGIPTPFDRIQATRYAFKCIEYLEAQANLPKPGAACIGMVQGGYEFTPLSRIPELFDEAKQRPIAQWWMDLRPIVRMLAQPNARYFRDSEQDSDLKP